MRNFLVSQSVPPSNISAQGLGENQPVAPNDGSSGRAQNRRVELVVSGAAIGLQSGATAKQPGTAAPAHEDGQTQGGTSPSEDANRGNFRMLGNDFDKGKPCSY